MAKKYLFYPAVFVKKATRTYCATLLFQAHKKPVIKSKKYILTTSKFIIVAAAAHAIQRINAYKKTTWRKFWKNDTG